MCTTCTHIDLRGKDREKWETIWNIQVGIILEPTNGAKLWIPIKVNLHSVKWINSSSFQELRFDLVQFGQATEVKRSSKQTTKSADSNVQQQRLWFG